jgi:preprotein translocase subunit SecA
VVRQYVRVATEGFAEDWDLEKLWTQMKTLYPVTLPMSDYAERDDLEREELEEAFVADAEAAYDRREEQLGADVMRELERRVLLTVLDRKWREHLYEMDYLREGIGLRAMAQRDPLVEYQREGGAMFNQMMEAFMEEVVGFVFHLDVQVQQAGPQVGVVTDGAGRPTRITSAPLVESGPDPDGPGVEVHTVGGDDDELEIEEPAEPAPETPFTRPKISAKGLDGSNGKRAVSYSAPGEDGSVATTTAKVTSEYDGVGRNAPCPCGSGKKFKMCHGRPGVS